MPFICAASWGWGVWQWSRFLETFLKNKSKKSILRLDLEFCTCTRPSSMARPCARSRMAMRSSTAATVLESIATIAGYVRRTVQVPNTAGTRLAIKSTDVPKKLLRASMPICPCYRRSALAYSPSWLRLNFWMLLTIYHVRRPSSPSSLIRFRLLASRSCARSTQLSSLTSLP